ncbi:hypothetical protein [Engelhardtia mirabilis]|uniref:hypothetical protein n=1 Tax=Engelhardtia mirabilis TaxID=2528011 RepID=UPI0011A180F5
MSVGLLIGSFAGLSNPAAAAALQASHAKPVPVEWEGKKYAVDELPEALSDASIKAILGWAQWAGDNDYRMSLTDDQRVLVVQHERRKPKDSFKLIEETAAIVDALLPAPAREEEDSQTTKRGETPVPIYDEDGTWTWKWEDDGGPLETDTAVILQLRSEPAQVAAVEKLTRDFDYLAEWGASAAARAGFSLERPLCSAWLESANGQEEWDPDHELINRVANMLVLRRFGQLPFWLQQGIAWHVEWESKETLYCYPYRAEFVYESEHSTWPTLLKQEFKERKDDPMALAEVAEWHRGTFDRERARKAFGFARFVAEHHADKFSAILEDLRLNRDANGRFFKEDGSWTRIPGWEVPIKDQDAIFAKHLGDDYLSEASEYFAKGKSYRPPS